LAPGSDRKIGKRTGGAEIIAPIRGLSHASLVEEFCHGDNSLGLGRTDFENAL